MYGKEERVIRPEGEGACRLFDVQFSRKRYMEQECRGAIRAFHFEVILLVTDYCQFHIELHIDAVRRYSSGNQLGDSTDMSIFEDIRMSRSVRFQLNSVSHRHCGYDTSDGLT